MISDLLRKGSENRTLSFPLCGHTARKWLLCHVSGPHAFNSVTNQQQKGGLTVHQSSAGPGRLDVPLPALDCINLFLFFVCSFLV